MKRAPQPPAPRTEGAAPSPSGAVAEFLHEALASRKPAGTALPSVGTAKGRLLFALDATASRQPTWDRACQIQDEMFKATAALGGLQVQLSYFRGSNEFRASPWLMNAHDLIDRMTAVRCQRGMTQIERVLAHAVGEARQQRVNALVYVGDAMEELPDALLERAGQLALLNVPVFVFHEGGDPDAAATFRRIARLTRGAYMSFDSNSAQMLRDLLAAVAIFAAGGPAALKDYSRSAGRDVQRLIEQMR